MPYFSSLIFSLLFCVFTFQSSADIIDYGKEFSGVYEYQLRNGLGKQIDHEIPLGPIAGKALVLFDAREATITELWDNGPGAVAGLKVGDRILKLNDKKFKKYSSQSGAPSEGFPETLGHAILEAQDSGKPLLFTVEREDEEIDLEVPLPKLPNFSQTFPSDCPRSDLHIKTAADYLARIQKKDGQWLHFGCTNGWTALALLATGDKKYMPNIKKTAYSLIQRYQVEEDPSSLSHEELIKRVGALDNWHHAVAGIFLAEYYLATGDKKVLNAIDMCCRRLEARLEPKTGRLGHQDTELPYKGFGLVIINTQAHILWGLSARIHDMERDWKGWELSMQAVKDATKTDGAVGYNKASPGQKQAAARSGSLVTGLVLADRDSKMQRQIGSWLYDNHHTFPDTHSMTSLGILYGFMGMKNTSPNKLSKVYKNYRWMYALTTPPNTEAGVYYYGCRDNTNGDKYINYNQVGNWLTIMTLCTQRNDTLWAFGNRTPNWMK